ncbi:MAG: M48 family metallopeptidase [Myxococcota bacterium]
MAKSSFAGGLSDFSHYVAQRKRSAFGGEGAPRYAYGADLAMLQTFRRIKPVEMAAASIVRMYKDVFKNQLLGTTVKVTPRQFPSLYKITEECAEALGVPVPTLYVANSPVMNAYTFGTDDDAFIVVHSALIDHYEPDELRFVIGHETGHIQNKHVVYGTVLILLKQSAAAILKFIAPPIDVALNSWYRRAEITCDRAGLLCCGDLESAARAFLKLGCGSQKLYGEFDVQEYVDQAQEGRSGVGRLAELFATHPYLPKRIEALQVFAESEYFRTAKGLGEGILYLYTEVTDHFVE